MSQKMSRKTTDQSCLGFLSSWKEHYLGKSGSGYSGGTEQSAAAPLGACGGHRCNLTVSDCIHAVHTAWAGH